MNEMADILAKTALTGPLLYQLLIDSGDVQLLNKYLPQLYIISHVTETFYSLGTKTSFLPVKAGAIFTRLCCLILPLNPYRHRAGLAPSKQYPIC